MGFLWGRGGVGSGKCISNKHISKMFFLLLMRWFDDNLILTKLSPFSQYNNSNKITVGSTKVWPNYEAIELDSSHLNKNIIKSRKCGWHKTGISENMPT